MGYTRGSFMTSLFRLGLLMLLCLLGVAAAILAWGLSNEVIRYTSEGPKLEFPITAVGEQSVTLPILAKPNRFADTLKEGRFTLVYGGGYGRLGAIVDERPDAVVRAFDLLAGEMPRAGGLARIDSLYYYNDPLEDLRLPFETLQFHHEQRSYPAWWLEHAEASAAVIVLHSHYPASISESLKVIPYFQTLGLSVLAMSYQHAPFSPLEQQTLSSEELGYRFAAQEWLLLQQGVDFLRQRGYQQLLFLGFGMGADIALELSQQQGASPFDLLILDSPFIQPKQLVYTMGKERALPRMVSELAAQFVAARLPLAWGKVDQSSVLASLETPVLLFAGTADTRVSIEVYDQAAASINAPLRYKRLKGSHHLEYWNQAPTDYFNEIRHFVETYAPHPNPTLSPTLGEE